MPLEDVISSSSWVSSLVVRATASFIAVSLLARLVSIILWDIPEQ